MRTNQLLALALLCAAALARAADSQPAATPYRPSVSAPAALPEPGWLDVEFGAQRIKGGGDKLRDSLPFAAKLAFDADWGVVLGGELAVHRSDWSGPSFDGLGDTTLLLKRRIATADEGTAWGFSVGFKTPTAKDSIGSGKSDALLTGIFSSDFAGDLHLDANLAVTRLGASGPREGRSQYAWALALSRSLNERWSIFAEPSGGSRRGVASTAQLMVGASYSLSKRVVFDCAVARGLNGASPDWQLLAGVTLLLGRLW